MLKNRQGKLITLEGIGGCGKSTQIDLLKKEFENKEDIIFTHDPGGTELSGKIKELMVENDMHPITECLLVYAARYELVQEHLIPNLLKNKTVICDRYIDSTTVYQGYKNMVGQPIRDWLTDLVLGPVMPDLTFLLNIDAEKAQERRIERYENTGRKSKFFYDDQRLLQWAFLEVARENQDRIVVVDANQEPELICKLMIKILRDREMLSL